MLKGTKTSKKKKNHHSKRQLYIGQRLSEDKIMTLNIKKKSRRRKSIKLENEKQHAFKKKKARS